MDDSRSEDLEETSNTPPGLTRGDQPVAMKVMSAPSGRDDHGRFAAGHPKIPGAGRRRGELISHAILRKLGEEGGSDAIAQMLVDVALGRLPVGLSASSTVAIRDRVQAAALLLDRSEGRAQSHVTITARSADVILARPSNWDEMPEAERLAHLDEVRRRAIAGAR